MGACVARLLLVWVVRLGHGCLRTRVRSRVVVAAHTGMCDRAVVLAQAGVCGRVVVTARARVGVVTQSSFVRAVQTR